MPDDATQLTGKEWEKLYQEGYDVPPEKPPAEKPPPKEREEPPPPVVVEPEEPERYVPTPPPEEEAIIIGASPTTKEILVKQPKTGAMQWLPATEEKVREAEKSVAELTELEQTAPKLYKILSTEGISAYEKAVEAEQKDWEARHIKLADDKWMLTEDWNKLFEGMPEEQMAKYQKEALREGGGYDAMVRVMDTDRKELEVQIAKWKDADRTLEQAGYKEGDKYLVVQALVSDNPEVVKAIKALFADRPDVIKEAQDFIKENYEPQWAEGTIPRKLSETWRKATPWKEEKGETVSTYTAKLIPTIYAVKPSPLEKNYIYLSRLLPFAKDIDITGVIQPAGKAFDTATQKSLDWINNTFLPKVEDWNKFWKKEFAEPSEWVTYGQRGEKIVTYRNIPRPTQAIGQGIIDLTTTIPATIAGVGASALLHLARGEQKEAALAPALLMAGMGEWMAGRPLAFARDPSFEIPYTVVLFRGAPVTTILKLARQAGITLDPRTINNTSLALEADIARATKPEFMDAFKARAMIEAVERAWGGAKEVPVGLKKLDPWDASLLTAVAKNKNVEFRSPDGKVIGRVSPFQMVVENSAFHATGSLNPIIKQLTKTGEFTVKPVGAYGGFWLSQQAPQAFMTRGTEGITNPGLAMVRYTLADIKSLPPEVLKVKNFIDMKKAVEKLAREGKLPPGIYPVFKYYGYPPKFELELFVSPKTTFKAVKSTWYAPDRGMGTASLWTESMIGARDPKTGLQIKPGQQLPVMILATASAIKEGLGVAPRLSQLYASKMLFTPYIGVSKWAPWRIRMREPAKGEAGIYTTTPYMSTWKALKLETSKQWLKRLEQTLGKEYAKYMPVVQALIERVTKDETSYRRTFSLTKEELAKTAKLAEDALKKGKDYNEVLLLERDKLIDAKIKEWFDPKRGEIVNWLKERGRLEELKERYGRLPYKAVERGKIRLYPEASLVSAGAYAKAVPKEYEPTAIPEYELVYPEIPLKYYPKPEPALEPVLYTPPYAPPYTPPYLPPKYPPQYPPEYPPKYLPKVPPKKTLPRARRLDIALGKGEETVKDYKGAVAWRQGMLKHKGKLEAMYRVWRRPFGQEDLEAFFESKLPEGVKITPGGVKSAYKSIQQYLGTIPPSEVKTADIGAFLATVKAPTKEPGKEGAIKFRIDPSETGRSVKKILPKLRHKKPKPKTGRRQKPMPMTGLYTTR